MKVRCRARSTRLPRIALLALGALSACATLATEAGDDDAERPNAMAGPFRMLREGELTSFEAPYVLKQNLTNFREPTVLDLAEAGRPEAAVMYAVARIAQVQGVFRFLADDGRSFAEKPDPAAAVLVATEPWEGAGLDAPEVARVGSEIFLYYSAEGGIGVARSSDGTTFTKQDQPVLSAQGAAAWEGGAVPRAPAFAEVRPGEYRLFYEANGRIGEASSADGVSWQRMGDAPVLEPVAAGAEPKLDDAEVGDPEAWQAESAEGRPVTRVYYTGRSTDGSTGIGMAARFSAAGSLDRAPAPALTGARSPRTPAVVPYSGLTLLFVTERAGTSSSTDYPAIAAGIAPANVEIPVPE